MANITELQWQVAPGVYITEKSNNDWQAAPGVYITENTTSNESTMIIYSPFDSPLFTSSITKSFIK